MRKLSISENTADWFILNNKQMYCHSFILLYNSSSLVISHGGKSPLILLPPFQHTHIYSITQKPLALFPTNEIYLDLIQLTWVTQHINSLSLEGKSNTNLCKKHLKGSRIYHIQDTETTVLNRSNIPNNPVKWITVDSAKYFI